MERIDLAAPDQVKPGTSTYTIAALVLNWKHKYWEAHLEGANGEQRVERVTEAEGAVADMIALNKANLSTANGSLQRRIINRLTALGRLSGTVSGTPD